ncbi:hypothetical protein V1L54_17485 [Streptomyces sp. TRM 70361]|uniref:hypothetical protein n=1 Tax=Streptomyces sp. TRM 70361 TaxID=3116553 RepID=UPI002E7B9302|nr:hypothetical protein [Streptomyces sp. TRM 70361]MEE1941175.1 hypothetical protein [Streptomyces sp. TRM 70361]
MRSEVGRALRRFAVAAACAVGAAGWVATEVLESGTRYDGPAEWVPAGEPGHPGPGGDPGAEPQSVRETAWGDGAVEVCEREPGPAPSPVPVPTLDPGPSPAPDPLGTAVVDTAVLCVVAAEESTDYRKWGLVAPPPRTPDR